MRILAIDPGFGRLGIALVGGNPSRPVVEMSRCVEPGRGAHERRLSRVTEAVGEAIKTHAPDALAIETLFFSTNRKTALKVAEARGAVLAAAGAALLPVIECSPQQVKLAVTGNGRADKRAIARMLPRLVALPARSRLDDELDAIAIGIAALAIGLPR